MKSPKQGRNSVSADWACPWWGSALAGEMSSTLLKPGIEISQASLIDKKM